MARLEKAIAAIGDPGFRTIVEEAKTIFAFDEKKSRLQKLHHLTQFFRQTSPLKGEVAECGSWQGLSFYFLCRTAYFLNPPFRGSGFHMFDSFQGLSSPVQKDECIREGNRSIAGRFAASLSDVRKALSGFPEIHYHPGWIPEVFAQLEESRYKFIHLDLDLYIPTKSAMEYFFPRLCPNGILVCDDYAAAEWPGVQKAVDEFSEAHHLAPLCLSTNQSVLIKW